MPLSLSNRVLSVFCGGRWFSGAVSHRYDDSIRGGRPTLANRQIAQAGMFDCFGLTDIGKLRRRNEDEFLITDLKNPVAFHPASSSFRDAMDMQGMPDANLLVVADGVGGNAGGEWASRLAVEGVAEYLHSHRMPTLHSEECCDVQILAALKSALTWAQQRIQREANSSPERARMGTTLTLAYVAWPTAYMAHAGDSRAYLYHKGELIQATQDQTIAQMLADAGVIDASRVERHPYQNVLGSLLSGNPCQLLPCVYQRALAPGDQLLLCTDGLTKNVTRSQIAEILESTMTAEDACRELIAAANDAGGGDNITVIVARFCGSAVHIAEDASESRGSASLPAQEGLSPACSCASASPSAKLRQPPCTGGSCRSRVRHPR
jgi:PPM family protein phosphatase